MAFLRKLLHSGGSRGSASGGGSISTDGSTTGTGARVAIVAADYEKHLADVHEKMETAHTFNMVREMPTVAHLRKFDVVVVWTASWARDGGATDFNTRAAGNLLADFVEGGGKVRARTRLKL